MGVKSTVKVTRQQAEDLYILHYKQLQALITEETAKVQAARLTDTELENETERLNDELCNARSRSMLGGYENYLIVPEGEQNV